MFKKHFKYKHNSSMARSSRRRCFVRIGVLRNFVELTVKHLCQSLLFNKVAGQACKFIKKETLVHVSFCEFCEIYKNTLFTEHIWGDCFSITAVKMTIFFPLNKIKYEKDGGVVFCVSRTFSYTIFNINKDALLALNQITISRTNTDKTTIVNTNEETFYKKTPQNKL